MTEPNFWAPQQPGPAAGGFSAGYVPPQPPATGHAASNASQPYPPQPPAAGYAVPQVGQPYPPHAYGGHPYSPHLPLEPQVRPLAGLGRTTVVLLSLQVLAALAAGIVAGWSALTYADLRGVGAGVQLAPDAAGLVVRLLTLPLMLLTAIFFVAWLMRATRNVRQTGTWTRHSPGWAIGAWFVPFLNLWRPKRMVDDVWRGSMPSTRPGTDLRLVAKPPVVLGWWALWLVAQGIASVGASKSMMTVFKTQIEALQAGTDPAVALSVIDFAPLRESEAIWQLWSSAGTALAALLAAFIVHQVTSWQTARMRGDSDAAGSQPRLPHSAEPTLAVPHGYPRG